MDREVPSAERERGFLLIADMEASTESKFRLGELGAFAAVQEHNRRIIDLCRKAAPVPGVILNSLGDAVVAKFAAGTDEADKRAALLACLQVARSIIETFENLPPVPGDGGAPFPLRTKITLQYYDAFLYGRRDELPGLGAELVGPAIDVAFRLQPISWRLQVVAAEPFVLELLRHAEPTRGPAPPSGTLQLVHAAHAAREAMAEQPRPGAPLSVPLSMGGVGLWIHDAREIARLKGIPDSQRLFLLSFEPPHALEARGMRARVALKVRQDHHALVLVSVSLEPGRNDEYIDYVIDTISDTQRGSRLESEITLYAAAKIYGEYDFFFRLSCIDDESLRRFLEALQDDRFGVDTVEVRSTISERFYVSPHYARILEHYGGRPPEIVLTWFKRPAGTDPFQRLVYGMDEERDAGVRPAEILEAGEVIHHRPVYALFACESLAAYSAFFDEHGISPTACRSHVGQITRDGDLRLRYGLMSGVWVPSRRRAAPGRAAD